ncbi:MAG: 4Fe-4S dicluster domain-containing protein [Desulfobacterales bacterium]|nr:4Fe-4S dicluster domain-containing protein [Desulfobacterales bacterium]
MVTESKEKIVLKFVCPICSETFTALNALKGHTMTQHGKEPEEKGWGKEHYPCPVGPAFIECDEMRCVGCGICQMACSMKHFGVINKELSRIQVRKYLLPLPKAVQVTCLQCRDEERECEKACPVDPPAIHFDKKSLHMVVDADRCVGFKCGKCREACSAGAVRFYPSVTKNAFLCDLCDTENTGDTAPECVNVCPYTALYFREATERFGHKIQDTMRKHPDEKAEWIAARLYPLRRDSMGNPGWR